MRLAICYTGKFGSTRQYATWLAEATGAPVFDLAKEEPDISAFDAFILGSSIIVMKPTIKDWLTAHWPALREKPILLFTVSGTEPGHPNLEIWLRNHLPDIILDSIDYVPLRGRLNIRELPWLVRLSLWIASLLEPDPHGKQRMRHGFDFMDRDSLRPILHWVDTHGQLIPATEEAAGVS
ncbi:MAG: hypothetical protein KDC54_04790 [Lewinella sp.]|nr:hypothetical protein [Lewinella sp.]